MYIANVHSCLQSLRDLVRDLGHFLDVVELVRCNQRPAGLHCTASHIGADISGNFHRSPDAHSIASSITASSDNGSTWQPIGRGKTAGAGQGATQSDWDLSGEVWGNWTGSYALEQVNETGVDLLVHMARRGCPATAGVLMDGLSLLQPLLVHRTQGPASSVVAAGMQSGVAGVLAACDKSGGAPQWLLRSAVMSQQVAMVDVAAAWAQEAAAAESTAACGTAARNKSAHAATSPWMAKDSCGLTPLHLAAVLPDTGAIAEHVLASFPCARSAWSTCCDARGVTAADLARSSGAGTRCDAVLQHFTWGGKVGGW